MRCSVEEYLYLMFWGCMSLVYFNLMQNDSILCDQRGYLSFVL